MFWLTFLVGVLYVPGLPSNAIVGRWIAFGVIVALLLWKIRIRPGPAHWMWVALLAWMVAGLAWAVSLWDHAAGIVQWTVMYLAFCIGSEADDLSPMWKGLAAAVSVSAGFAVAQALGANLVWSLYDGGDVGLYLSKNMAAEAVTLALIGAIGVVAREGFRSAWMLPGPLVSAWLVNSRTATAMLILAGAAALYLRLDREDRPTALLAGVLVAALGAILLLVFPSAIHGGLFKIDDRLGIWRIVAENMVLPWGDGWGSFQIAVVDLEFAHSEFLQGAFELGAGSLLIWGIVAYAISSSGRTGDRAALVALLAPCAFWWPLHAPVTAMAFALLAGGLCGARRRARSAESGGGAGRL